MDLNNTTEYSPSEPSSSTSQYPMSHQEKADESSNPLQRVQLSNVDIWEPQLRGSSVACSHIHSTTGECSESNSEESRHVSRVTSYSGTNVIQHFTQARPLTVAFPSDVCPVLGVPECTNVASNRGGKNRNFIQGHSFVKRTFAKPLTCHHCSEMMWGLFKTTALLCEICNFSVHEKCMRFIVTPCATILPFLVTEPVPHCWSDPGQFKRKFCNVCRKRVDDDTSVSCEVCECYSHMDCMDFVASNCKQCAVSIANEDLPDRPFQQQHHWREGNLPVNSRCALCHKSCWSSECLTGMQCLWCNSTAHASCHLKLPKECNYGVLRDIVLPPSAVSIPRTSIIMEHLIGLQKPPQTLITSSARFIQDEPSSTESREESLPTYSTEKRGAKDKSEKDSDDCVRIYDGFARLRRRQCRFLAIDKSHSALTVTEMALKAFMISPMEAAEYMLIEVSEKATSLSHANDCYSQWAKSGSSFSHWNENLLKELQGSFRRQLKFDTKRPHIIFLPCCRDAEKMTINISPGTLMRQGNSIASISQMQIQVDKFTTARMALQIAFRKFSILDVDINDCVLVQSCTDRGVTEREVGKDEPLWSLIKHVMEESVRAWRLTTFQIRRRRHIQPEPSTRPNHQKALSHASNIATTVVASAELFVGSLRKGLSQKLYEKILLDFLGEANRWDGIEVIYHDFGSLVLRYGSAEKADKAYNILRNCVSEGNKVLVLILPRLVPSMVPDNVNPLLVFVNVKSGGCQGIDLITSFRKLLNPHQVFTLDYGGPLPGLHCFRQIAKFKILVCGGDGTVGWALSCLDNVGQDAVCSTPPIAIVPLGTGNDLARVLCWGSGYTGTEEPLSLLQDVSEAEEIRLDRWTVMIKPNQNEQDDQKRALQLQVNSSCTNEDTTRIFVMNNYFGIGIDADLNLDFHMAREENPEKFNSRFRNKGVYFKMGLRKMVYRSRCKDLQQKLTLEVDGRRIDLPPLEGIIILNILSWAAGANPWGSSSSSSASIQATSNISPTGASGSINSGGGDSGYFGNGSQPYPYGANTSSPHQQNQQQTPQFSNPTHYDGMLEVVGVSGVIHMGQIVSGLRTGNRIAQGGHIRICLKEEIPVQVDGEPWVQAPGQIVVLRSALRATMLKKRKRSRLNRRNTEPSIGALVATADSESTIADATTVLVDAIPPISGHMINPGNISSDIDSEINGNVEIVCEAREGLQTNPNESSTPISQQLSSSGNPTCSTNLRCRQLP